ncbi:hypothetical protein [Thermoleptolyngbya sp. M55_K2018_002]|nr:hypothetical protein [Thermoleptolyngbya sp. M55_K2018_002]HIK40523.1 hypothetical protein [Thermoleptolyngbya sp. M55_K2018_002]
MSRYVSAANWGCKLGLQIGAANWGCKSGLQVGLQIRAANPGWPQATKPV